jgi:hypothetical protein
MVFGSVLQNGEISMLDSDWLAIDLGREPTYDEAYEFTERVAIMWDGGTSEHRARELALVEFKINHPDF